MMVGKSFKIGDLVWVKQPGQDNWPGRIEKPPKDLHSPSKKTHCYVRFFAINKTSWVKNKAVVLHSEDMLQTSSKRKSASLKKAIEEITALSQTEHREISDVPQKDPKEEDCVMSLSGKETLEEHENVNKDESNNSLSEMIIDKSIEEREICDTEVCSSSAVNELVENGKSLLVDNSEDHSDVKQYLGIEKEPVDISMSVPSGDSLNVECSGVVMTSVDTVNLTLNSSDLELGPSEQTNNSEFLEQSDVVLTPNGAADLLPNSNTEQPMIDAATVRNQIKDKVCHKIGFIGLGRIGSVIVRELMNAGNDVTIWNRSEEKCKSLVNDGAHQADSPSDVIAKCDITFSCVSDSEASKLLVFGPQGILNGIVGSEAGSKGYVELSSIDPSTSEEIGKAVSDAGGLYLEAPVSLSKDPEKDKMMIIAAGNRDLFDKCVFYFRSISKTTYFISCEVGNASKLNAIIGSLHGVLYGLLAESLKLAEKSNLSPNTFLSFLDQVADLPTYFIERGKAMLGSHSSVTTTLKHQLKLNNLALSLGADKESLNRATDKVSLSLSANKSSSSNVDKLSSSSDTVDKSEYVNPLISFCTQKIFNEALEKFSDKDVSAVYMSI